MASVEPLRDVAQEIAAAQGFLVEPGEREETQRTRQGRQQSRAGEGDSADLEPAKGPEPEKDEADGTQAERQAQAQIAPEAALEPVSPGQPQARRRASVEPPDRQ